MARGSIRGPRFWHRVYEFVPAASRVCGWRSRVRHPEHPAPAACTRLVMLVKGPQWLAIHCRRMVTWFPRPAPAEDDCVEGPQDPVTYCTADGAVQKHASNVDHILHGRFLTPAGLGSFCNFWKW